MVDFAVLVILSSIVIHVAKTIVDFRQVTKFTEAEVPSALTALVTPEEFDKSQKYNFDKLSFGLLKQHIGIVEEVVAVIFGFLLKIWMGSEQVAECLGLSSEVATSVLFMYILFFMSKASDIAFGFYTTFVIEARYGFNKSTVGLFFKDTIKGAVIELIIQTFVVSGLVWIMNNAGEQFFLYVWGFLSVVLLVIFLTYHDLIAPCFNKFTELEDSKLKDKIFELADSLKFPLKKIYVIDGSTRSSHSNAYFFGFGSNKRIVIYDTLLDKAKGITDDEITAIVAHELGHWHHSHSLRGLVLTEVQIFATFYIFSLVINNLDMYASFGFSKPIALVGLLLFSYIAQPVNFMLGYFIMKLSRFHEYQADAFAKRLGHGAALSSGLIKMFTKNSGNMNPDPWYSALHFSHPTMLERLKALEEKDKAD